MRKGYPASPLSAGLRPGAMVEVAPYPVLVVNRDGAVVEHNPAAGALLDSPPPGTLLRDAAPDWLAQAHARLAAGSGGPAEHTDVVRGQIADRSFEAHPTCLESEEIIWWLVDETDRVLAERALRAEQERTDFLSRASTVLLSSLNPDRCVDATARLAGSYLADAAVVISPSRHGELPAAYYSRDADGVTHRLIDTDPAVLPGLAEALQGFPPVPSRWIDPDTMPQWLVPADFTEPIGSVIVTPLPGHGVPAGVLVLLRKAGPPIFSREEEIFARLFAARAGSALSAARLYAQQAVITATLMRDLLPPRLHHVHGVDFAGGYTASEDHERVSGDFYDLYPGSEPSQESLVALGDVAGKGLDAAVLAGKIRNTLHALLPIAAEHEQVLSLLNTALLSSRDIRFATVVLASVVRVGDQVSLRMTSAGHPPPLIIRSDGRVEEVATQGRPVGAFREFTARTVNAMLNPGDTCLLYTDGVTEARGGPFGGDMFGERRLHDTLAQCGGLPAEAIVERLQMLTSQWIRVGRHDDIALVAITAPRRTTPSRSS